MILTSTLWPCTWLKEVGSVNWHLGWFKIVLLRKNHGDWYKKIRQLDMRFDFTTRFQVSLKFIRMNEEAGLTRSRISRRTCNTEILQAVLSFFLGIAECMKCILLEITHHFCYMTSSPSWQLVLSNPFRKCVCLLCITVYYCICLHQTWNDHPHIDPYRMIQNVSGFLTQPSIQDCQSLVSMAYSSALLGFANPVSGLNHVHILLQHFGSRRFPGHVACTGRPCGPKAQSLQGHVMSTSQSQSFKFLQAEEFSIMVYSLGVLNFRSG